MQRTAGSGAAGTGTARLPLAEGDGGEPARLLSLALTPPPAMPLTGCPSDKGAYVLKSETRQARPTTPSHRVRPPLLQHRAIGERHGLLQGCDPRDETGRARVVDDAVTKPVRRVKLRLGAAHREWAGFDVTIGQQLRFRVSQAAVSRPIRVADHQVGLWPGSWHRRPPVPTRASTSPRVLTREGKTVRCTFPVQVGSEGSCHHVCGGAHGTLRFASPGQALTPIFLVVLECVRRTTASAAYSRAARSLTPSSCSPLPTLAADRQAHERTRCSGYWDVSHCMRSSPHTYRPVHEARD